MYPMPQPHDILIRIEEPGDFDAIRIVIDDAFSKVEISDNLENALVDCIRKSPAYIPELAMVATVDGEICGYILLSRIWIVSGEEKDELLSLAPVAVAPSRQHSGIGSRLIIHAHEKARAMGYRGVVLVGHESYYPRFGYKPAASFGITFPFEAPDQNCMAVELYEDALKDISGVVQSPEELNEILGLQEDHA